MRLLTALLFICLLTTIAVAQQHSAFCRAAGKGDFRKVARIVNKQVRLRKHGLQYDNGPGSGMQVTHTLDLDTLTLWFKSQPCVEDAAWDKCQNKIAIYPGWAIIGVRFNTRSGVKEICFHIQEGTTGTLQLFGWHPHLFKLKNILIFKKYYESEGFVEQQKKNCEEYLKR